VGVSLKKSKMEKLNSHLYIIYRFTLACKAIFLYWWDKWLIGLDIKNVANVEISTLLSGAVEVMYYLTQYGKVEIALKTENLIRETLKGLLATAIEKICVLGVEDAKADIKQIREMYEELVRFWDLDERLVDEFDMEVGSIGTE